MLTVQIGLFDICDILTNTNRDVLNASIFIIFNPHPMAYQILLLPHGEGGLETIKGAKFDPTIRTRSLVINWSKKFTEINSNP